MEESETPSTLYGNAVYGWSPSASRAASGRTLRRCRRAALFAKAYSRARKLASAETGLPLNTLPIDPLLTLDEMSSEDDAPWQADDVLRPSSGR